MIWHKKKKIVETTNLENIFLQCSNDNIFFFGQINLNNLFSSDSKSFWVSDD